MGGKDKKGPRTKGNTKPSSSGRSAVLLGNVTEFVGFSGLPEGSYVPVVGVKSSVEDASNDLSIPADFRLSLRKMGKRDSTTKIKALQEFSELCEQNTVDTLKTVLPFWPRIFSRLAVDEDRRVREYLHKAHLQLVSQLGRNLAPYLKEMMGAWFTSQCDTYAPASFVATQSLKTCFPGDKLPDAIAFCHNEIMDYTWDSLFKEDIVSDEQRERIAIGGISGYSLLLQQIKSNTLKDDKYLEQHFEMWKNSKLYKVVDKNKSLPIKQAWFGMVYNLAHYLPQIVQENCKKIFSCVFAFLDDPESTSQLPLWETTLKLMVTVENASSYVNLPSHATPRFLDLLRNACSGNASKIGPLILPYTRLLRDHQENDSKKEELDRKVMEAIFLGLSCRSISNSSSEASSLSGAIFQILDYIMKVTQDGSHLREILQTTVIPSLDLLIKSRCSNLVFSAVVRQMTLTLNSLFGTDEGMATIFWNSLEHLLLGLITQPPHPDSSVVEYVGLFILVLMDAHSKLDNRSKLAKRSVRIRFADTVLKEEKKCDESLTRLPEMPIAFREKVVKMSVHVCKDTLECCEKSDCETCLQLLTSLMGCKDILEGILVTESVTVENILNLLIRMLHKLRDENTSSLFFMILEVVDPDLRHRILEDVSVDELTCIALATTALETPGCMSNKQVVLEWMQSPHVSNLLVRTAQRVSSISNEDKHGEISWRLIQSAINSARKLPMKEPLLPKQQLNDIMNALIGNLYAEHLDNDPMTLFIKMLSDILKPFTDWNLFLEPSSKWLDTLVEVLCTSTRIQPESFKILLELWTHGASYDVHLRCKSAVIIIKQKLFTIPEMRVAENLIEIFQQVLELHLQQNDPETSRLLVCQILPTESEWNNWMNDTNSCDLMAKEIMSGQYCHPTPIANKFRPVQLKSWCGLLKAAFVVSSIAIRNNVCEQDRSRLVPNVFYASAVADLLLDINKKRLKDSALKDVEKICEVVEKNASVLLSFCSLSEQHDLFKKLILNSRQRRWVWYFATRKFQQSCPQILEESEVTEDIVLTLSNVSDENLNKISRLQMTKLSSVATDSWFTNVQLLASIRYLLKGLKAKATDDTITEIIESVKVLQSWQLKHDDSFLFGCDLKVETGTSPETVWTVIEIIRLLSTIVELYPQNLSHSSWDFTLCSMTSWCSTLEESWTDASPNQYSNPALLSFTVALCHLIKNCGALIADVEKNKEGVYTTFPPNLVSEWNDVFSDVAYNAILPLFFQLSRCNTLSHISSFYLMETLASSVCSASVKNIQLQVEKLSPLLLAKHSAIQFAVHGLIEKLLPHITSSEAASSKEDDQGDQEKTERSPPEALLIPLEKVTFGVLAEIRCGDLHVIEPYSGECTQILGYFLSWDLVLRLCGCSGSELRYQYASYLSNSKLMDQLMNILFCIIPHASFQQQAVLEMKFEPDVIVTEKAIQDMAIQVYSSALRYLPAVVRRWCNNADKRTASLVEKFTSRCVSPVLCALDLQFCSKTWDNMTVRVRPTAREVIATYKLNEEGSMELIAKLPANYPLGSIIVETGRKVGVTSNQWRSWILQLQTFLMQQNGSILDGLTLWKRNVDKRFEGVEECYICYYVLHGSNYQLPKLSCRTCRKKFHADCLYKWFSTSNNSTCPLCRNLF